MALTPGNAFSHILILVGLLSIFLVTPSSCFNPKKHVNASSYNSSLAGSVWSPAVATWYGPPHGDGSEGGACGYGAAVGRPPFSSMISAGNPSIYASGKGCGACYEVMCTTNSACSRKPVRVIITDECPGCTDAQYHFDLSGTAFGAMAISGRDDQLRTAGKINIQHRRVPCNYPGMEITFHVDSGSNPEYFATLIEYVNGYGVLVKVELKEAHSTTWESMQESWGAVWRLNKGSALIAPFSIRVTTQSGKSLVANNVIPAGWKPSQTYGSVVNFPG